MKLLYPTACNFMVYKDYKNRLFKIFLAGMWNQLQDARPHLFFYQSSCHHSSQYFFEVSPMYFLAMICCFRSFSRYVILVGISEPKIVSLYLVTVSLMAYSSSSFVFIKFLRGILNFFASSNSTALFIYYY